MRENKGLRGISVRNNEAAAGGRRTLEV